MDNKTINLYLSRILSGFYIIVLEKIYYKLIYPDIYIKYEAELYAQEEYDSNKFNDWVSEEDLLYTLVDLGLWTLDGDDKLKKISSQIDDTKVEIYRNFFNNTKLKSLRKTLTGLNKSYNKLYSIRHSLDHLTVDGFSQILKNQYLLINSLYLEDKKVFDNVRNADYVLLNNLSNIINDNSIGIDTFRKIARSDVWKNYWSANKNNIFDKAGIHWTDEQKTLVVLTKMYDNAQEHPECPADNIIDDDDAFDGWMILQRRENEKNRNKQRTEKMLGNKLGKAGEVFLMANSKEEAQSIYGLNDQASQNIIKERNQTVFNSDKAINETSLPDVQRNLQMQRNQLMLKRK